MLRSMFVHTEDPLEVETLQFSLATKNEICVISVGFLTHLDVPARFYASLQHLRRQVFSVHFLYSVTLPLL